MKHLEEVKLEFNRELFRYLYILNPDDQH